MRDLFWVFSVLVFVGCQGSGVMPSFEGKEVADNSVGKPFVQMGHTGNNIQSVAISPNGKYIVSGGQDNVIKLWDVKSTKEIKSFKGHTSRKGTRPCVNSVAFSPNGKYIVSGSNDKTIKLWSIKSGKEVKTFKGHTGSIYSVQFSFNGKYIISGGGDKLIKLWDIKSGKELKTFRGHLSGISSVGFSLNGKYIVSGDYDKFIKLWDIKSGKELKTFKGHSGFITSVKFSRNGKYIASASSDKTIKLWDIENGHQLRTFKGHTDRVTSIAFSPSGKYIVSSSWDRTIKLWDIKTGEEVKTFKGYGTRIVSVAFSLDGKYIISGYRGGVILLWSIRGEKKFKAYVKKINSVMFSPDGKYITSCSFNGFYTLDVKYKKKLQQSSNYSYSTHSLDISSNNKYSITGNWNNTLTLWDMKSRKELKTFKGHSDYVESVSFSKNNKYVFSGSRDKTIKKWDVESGKVIKTLTLDSSYSNALSLSKDNEFLISGGWDGIIRQWNLDTGEELKSFGSTKQVIYSISITPNNKFILYGDSDSITMIDRKNGKMIKEFSGHIRPVEAIVITSNGKQMISGSWDKTIKLWDIGTGKVLKTLKGHLSRISSISLSPNEKYIISSSNDGTIKLWDIKTGKELISIVIFYNGEWITITPDGYFDASKNGAKHLNVLTDSLTVTSVDKYYEKFYRPEIVKLALQGKTIPNLPKMSDIKAPPIVKIFKKKAETNAQSISIDVKITPKSGGVGKIKVMNNGTAISLDTRAFGKSSASKPFTKSYTVKLLKGVNTISVSAFEKTNSLEGEASVYTVNSTYSKPYKAKIHAIILGVQEFSNSDFNLNNTRADAKIFTKVLEKQKHNGLFDGGNIVHLKTKEEKSKTNILKEFEKMSNIRPEDVFVFYVGSHGEVRDGVYYLIPSNMEDDSTQSLKKDALSADELAEAIAKIQTRQKMIILDTCYAGKAGGKIKAKLVEQNRGMTPETATNIFSNALKTMVFSSATSFEEANENYKGHGIFTYFVVKGLEGKANTNNNSFITTLELMTYVTNNVPEESDKVLHHKQNPVINYDGQVFDVARVE